mmetsp:Transcript_27298/g.63588  ORF Transcript_27298/g.63588 Transcript_27298/m.63588 type:complete len:340 (+) Transcript_27298:2-1021(+)
MPLAHAQIVVSLFYCVFIGLLILGLSLWFVPRFYIQALSVGGALAAWLGARQARVSARHLFALPEQLASFSVARSHCFCCDQGHKWLNGEQIPCDREVVYRTISDWFGDEDGTPVATGIALERFNFAVRTHFGRKVLLVAGPTMLPYRYALIATWPFIFRGCDVIAAADKLSMSYRWNDSLAYPIMGLFGGPIFYKLVMIATRYFEKRVGKNSNRVVDELFSVLLGAVFLLTSFVVWWPVELLASFDSAVWPLAIVGLVYAGAAAALYHEDTRQAAATTSGLPERVRRASSESHDSGRSQGLSSPRNRSKVHDDPRPPPQVDGGRMLKTGSDRSNSFSI